MQKKLHPMSPLRMFQYLYWMIRQKYKLTHFLQWKLKHSYLMRAYKIKKNLLAAVHYVAINYYFWYILYLLLLNNHQALLFFSVINSISATVYLKGMENVTLEFFRANDMEQGDIIQHLVSIVPCVKSSVPRVIIQHGDMRILVL